MRSRLLCVASLLVLAPLPVWGAAFAGLGKLPTTPGNASTDAGGISGDGAVVVGESGASAFRWTFASGMVDLGASFAGASDASEDGAVVVGHHHNGSYFEAYQWTAAAGIVGLGDLPGGDFSSGAGSVSADGSVVVGTSVDASQARRPVMWTGAGGPVVLSGFGPLGSAAEAVSADGAVVAGSTDTVGPFLWTAATGPLYLGIPGGAHDLSADGSTVVGSDFTQAYRWTDAGGVELLGTLVPGQFTRSLARGVSADGSVVVGQRGSTGNMDQEAWIWDETNGARSLRSVLEGLGLVLTGWTLRSAVGISDDGTVIVGNATNPQGRDEPFLAALVSPCENGLDDDGDGATDHPADAGCASPAALGEAPQCSDGLDNDNDGRIDWDGGGVPGASHDPQCTAAFQNREKISSQACGLGFEIALPLALLLARWRRRGAVAA